MSGATEFPLWRWLRIVGTLVSLLAGLGTVGKIIDGASFQDAAGTVLGWAAPIYQFVGAAALFSRVPSSRRYEAVLLVLAGAFCVAMGVVMLSDRSDSVVRVLGGAYLTLVVCGVAWFGYEAFRRSQKTCPDCAETVKSAAHVCRYCGFRFSERPRAGAKVTRA